MPAVRKYLFDNDFGNPEAKRAQRPAFTEADIEAAKREAFEEGRSAAEQAFRDAEERRIAEVLGAVAARIETLVAERQADLETLSHESAAVAVAICRTILPPLAGRNALDALGGLTVHCLAALHDDPRG